MNTNEVLNKLKAEIERRKIEWKALFDGGENTAAKECFYEDENILVIIDSLQQEQPAKRGYKDCNGCEYNRLLKDQIGWQFRGCFGGDYKGKPIAEIELCPLKLAVQQEQPTKGYDEAYLDECIAKARKTWEGVDADKYLDEVRGREQEQSEVDLEKAARNVYESWMGGTMDDFLRDMVELGKALNARKEK